MKKLMSFWVVLAVAAIVISCSKDNAESTNNNGGSTGACSGTPGPLFNAVRNILQSNCALSGCHSGSNPQNGINFTDNCTIVAQKDRIKFRAVDQAGTPSQMPPPPNASLSASDRQKLTDWVNAGGKLTD